MKTRFVIFVVLFGLMCGAVSAQPPVAFDFSAQCTGFETGKSIIGTFSYDPSVGGITITNNNDSDFLFGEWTGRRYTFPPNSSEVNIGGPNFGGSFVDSFKNSGNAEISLVDGTIRDLFIFEISGPPSFKVELLTTDVTLVNGLDLPTILFLPASGPNTGAYSDGAMGCNFPIQTLSLFVSGLQLQWNGGLASRHRFSSSWWRDN